MHKNRLYVRTAAILGALAVVIGAFGAHALKDVLKPEQLTGFETGSRYHFYHVFALVLTGILYKRYHNMNLKRAAQFFIAGIALFSGSLYASTLLQAMGTNGLGRFSLLTPMGGLLLVIGWIYLLLGVPSNRTDSDASGD